MTYAQARCPEILLYVYIVGMKWGSLHQSGLEEPQGTSMCHQGSVSVDHEVLMFLGKEESGAYQDCPCCLHGSPRADFTPAPILWPVSTEAENLEGHT